MMRKATLPTMREAGLSFEDLDALRLIPHYRKTSFYQPQLLNKPANIDYEKRTASKKPEYKRIPGLQTELGPLQNNIHSYFVNPATRLGALAGDVTFGAKPILLGIRNRDNDYGVDFWRTQRQGAGSEGGEGLIYGQLPKQNFAEIPIDFTTVDALRAKLNLDHYMNTFHMPEEKAFESLEANFPEVYSIASQFPNVSTESTSWQQPAQYRGTNPLLLDDIDRKVASEPMDLTMRLLKRELHPGENQYKHRYKMPNRDDVHPEWYDWIQETLDNPAEYEGIADDFQQPDINHLASATSREDFFEKLYDLHNFQVDDARPPFDDIEGKYRDFTDVPFSEETGFTRSEPMDLAWRLLKNEPEDYRNTFHRVRNNVGADGGYMTDEELNSIDERYSELHDDESHLEEYYNLLEAIELEKKRRAEGSFDGMGLNEKTGFTRSEPMEIAMQLLKERVSPEAKRHKLEYDKKYESSPERVKYREELNRERRRRHIMGRGGPDMSHTKDHNIVPEDPHTNRARHFKDKGTLL